MTPAARDALQSMDIFQLLGYAGTDEVEKNQILEEAQNLLIQDLVDTDLVTRLSPEDLSQAKQMLTDELKPMIARQTDLLAWLHEKVADLDQILLDKTAQMKHEVLEEFLNDLKQRYAQEAFASQQLAQAELWFHRENYAEALRILQSVAARTPGV